MRSKIAVLLFAALHVLVFQSIVVVGKAWAQDRSAGRWKDRGEVFGSIGAGRFHHGDNVLGGGLDWGGGVGIRPFQGALRNLGFEFLFNGMSFERTWGNGYSNMGDLRCASGNVTYHLGRSRTQFYAVGGLGILHANYITVNGYMKNELGLPEYSSHPEDTKIALNLGFGLKARITKRLSVRPELRLIDTTMGKGYNWSYLRMSVGLGYHF